MGLIWHKISKSIVTVLIVFVFLRCPDPYLYLHYSAYLVFERFCLLLQVSHTHPYALTHTHRHTQRYTYIHLPPRLSYLPSQTKVTTVLTIWLLRLTTHQRPPSPTSNTSRPVTVTLLTLPWNCYLLSDNPSVKQNSSTSLPVKTDRWSKTTIQRKKKRKKAFFRRRVNIMVTT